MKTRIVQDEPNDPVFRRGVWNADNPNRRGGRKLRDDSDEWVSSLRTSS